MSEEKYYMQTSIPSIDQNLPNNQHSQYQYSKQQYIINLQKQIEYQKTAIITAENLINTYRIQNQQLSSEKYKLTKLLDNANKKIQVLETAILNSNYHHKNILQLSNQITNLLEKQTEYQLKIQFMSQKISNLQQQIIQKNQKKQKKEFQRNQQKLKDIRINFFNKDHLNISKILHHRKPIQIPIQQRTKYIRKVCCQQIPKNRQKISSMLNKSLFTQIQEQIDHELMKKDYYSLRSKTVADTSIQFPKQKIDKKYNKTSKYGCISYNKSGKSQSLRR